MKKNYRIMVVRYGYAEVEGDSESEALEKSKNLTEHDFDWSDLDDHQIIEEVDY